MSDPRNPAAPAKVRPSSVTTASYLLFLVAALQVVDFIAALSVWGAFSDVYDRAFAGTELEGSGPTLAAVGLFGTEGVSLIAGVGLVVLAVLNNRGKNPARIVTWVFGGIFLCCGGLIQASQVAGNALGMGRSNAPNVPDQAEIQRMLDERLPSWYMPVTTTLGVFSLIALLVALILLALPRSNEFFRKSQTAWEPPVPGSAYPGYPPAYPGYPPANPPAGPSGPHSQPPTPPGS